MTISATVDGQLVQWRDSKRYLWIMGAIIPLIPMAMWGLYALTGSTLSWFFGPFFVYVLIPTFDLLAGLDPNNPPEELIEAIEEDRYYRWVTYAFLPLQLVGLIWGAYLLGGGTLPGIEDPLTVVQKIGLATGLGMVAGIGINTAHELGHKKEHMERWFAASPWPRRSTATSTSSTTAATTCASRRRRTRPAPASARPSGSSCRAPSAAASRAPGAWRRSASTGSARAPSR